MSSSRPFAIVLVPAAVVCILAGPLRAAPADPAGWDPKSAASYLDGREAWWAAWPTAARDHGTFCVSCHTALPYALARPALRVALGEREHAAPEVRLLDNVVSRVSRWDEMAPYYSDQTRGLPKTSESRGTEAIINATILATRDREHGRLTDETRSAFAHLWALQMHVGPFSGAWAWLDFHTEPWESSNSPFFGAALAAIAVGAAPEAYASAPEVQPNLDLLRAYVARESSRQPLLNRLMLLWASGSVRDLVADNERQAIIDAALRRQRDDGGWSLASLGTFARSDGTPIDGGSDGYATGLATLALEKAGLPVSSAGPRRGLEWLRQHQDRSTGRWTASSLNKRRNPSSDAGQFMNDAATSVAVLALTAAR